MSGLSGLGDYVRYSLLALDPGLQQLKQASKTVFAVVIALVAFHNVSSTAALFSGMCAGFLMQCTAGTALRQKQKIMAVTCAAVVVSVGGGNALAAHEWLKIALLSAVAFTVYYVRRFLPGKAMFPLYAFTLTLLATLRSFAPLLYMAAAATGAVSAFVAYFYVLPDETLLAFRNSLNLFLFHANRLQLNPRARKHLYVLRAAIAFNQSEMDRLCVLYPDICQKVLRDQYEALQLLTILVDIAREEGSDAAKQATILFCRAEWQAVDRELAGDQARLRTA